MCKPDCECCKKPSFDPKKPVQTRDGRDARILCTDMKSASGRSILALVRGKEELGYTIRCYYSTGQTHGYVMEYGDDLVNTVVVTKSYQNIYDHMTGKITTDEKTSLNLRANQAVGESLGTIVRTYHDGTFHDVEFVR